MRRGAGNMGRRFWGSALGAALLVAAGVAGAVPLFLRLEPRGGLRLQTPTELWLLGVFTLGALAVLLGLSAAAGGWFGPSEARRGLERMRREADRLDARRRQEADGPAGHGGPPARAEPGSGPLPPTEALPEGPGNALDAGLDPETDAGPDPAWWVTATGAFLLAVYGVGWLVLG